MAAKTRLTAVLDVGAAKGDGLYVRVGETKTGGYQYVGPFHSKASARVFAWLAFPNAPANREPIEPWTRAEIAAGSEDGCDRFDLPTDRFVDRAGWGDRSLTAAVVAGMLEDAAK